ncbi:MAG: bifunctional nuclease family protein [Paludibacteraceae bacterium]|nr:bifunctional nuclease family protein [Paludibacteraceae bacterium]
MKEYLCMFEQNRTFACQCVRIMEGFVQLKIACLAYLGKESRGVVLTLQEVGGERKFSIVIGRDEATSIEAFIHQIDLPVSLTHDMMCKVMRNFELRVHDVIIQGMKDGVFQTTMEVVNENSSVRVSARVSDAIAMALRFNRPVYIEETLLERVRRQQAGVSLSAKKNEDVDKQMDLGAYSVEQLNAFLKSCVKHEDYERAILVRDELNRRNSLQSEN